MREDGAPDATSGTYPSPYAEEIRRSHLCRLRVSLAAGALGAFLGLYACFGAVLRLLADTGEADMAMLVAMSLPWYPLMFTMALFELGKSMAAVAGHGRVGMKTVSGYHMKAPRSVGRTRAAVLLWAIAAALAGAAVSAPWPWPAYLPFEKTLPGLDFGNPSHAALLLACLALAALFARRAAACTRDAAAGWRAERERLAKRAEILACGGHAVGEVAGVRFTGECVDMKSLFVVDLVYRAGGREHAVAFAFPEYPCWAPVVGNAFDVWFDPAAPAAPGTTLLQRRLAGQATPPEPERYRVRLQTDGSPLTDVVPEWARPGKVAPGESEGLAVFRMLGLLLAIGLWVASVPVWHRALPGAPGWVVLLVVPHLALAAAGLLGWWKRLQRPARGPDAWAWARAAGFASLALGFVTWPLAFAQVRPAVEAYIRSEAALYFPVDLSEPFNLWLALALAGWTLASVFGIALPRVSDQDWARRLRRRARTPLSAEAVYEALYSSTGEARRDGAR